MRGNDGNPPYIVPPISSAIPALASAVHGKSIETEFLPAAVSVLGTAARFAPD